MFSEEIVVAVLEELNRVFAYKKDDPLKKAIDIPATIKWMKENQDVIIDRKEVMDPPAGFSR